MESHRTFATAIQNTKTMNSDEIWLPVTGYENLYEVSSLGRVRSLARMTKQAGMRGGSMLWPQKNRYGYLRVGLSKNGEQKFYKVHRLVATAFIPNPLNLPQVNHKNERKDDNRAENLEWCDAAYNNAYGTRTERTSNVVYQYDLDGAPVAWYQSTHEAARRTGLDCGGIAMCANGKCKTFGGFQWRYEPSLFLDVTESGWKNNANSKRIYQYDAQTGRFVKEWPSAMEVQRQTGWHHGNINACARSKRNQAYGFRWFYTFQGYKIKEGA